MMSGLLPFALQCAMCYQTAAQQGAKGIAALNSGILVLVVPLIGIVGGLTWMAWRHRG